MDYELLVFNIGTGRSLRKIYLGYSDDNKEFEVSERASNPRLIKSYPRGPDFERTVAAFDEALSDIRSVVGRKKLSILWNKTIYSDGEVRRYLTGRTSKRIASLPK